MATLVTAWWALPVPCGMVTEVPHSALSIQEAGWQEAPYFSSFTPVLCEGRTLARVGSCAPGLVRQKPGSVQRAISAPAEATAPDDDSLKGFLR